MDKLWLRGDTLDAVNNVHYLHHSGGVAETAASLVSVIPSTAVEIATGKKRRRRPQGWCASAKVGSKLHAASMEREKARMALSPNPAFVSRGEILKTAGNNLQQARAVVVHVFFEK